jgi:hypothetical protein
MTDLEQRLTALAGALDVPPAPDVVPTVLAALPARGPARGRWTRPRRTAAVAGALALVLAGTAFALPPTRHAILRALGLRGETIERVRRLPPVPQGARLHLGHRIPVDRARRAAGFRALLPPRVTAAYRDGRRLWLLSGGALIAEFPGTSIPVFMKFVGPGTHVDRLRLQGHPAVYIHGAPHALGYLGPGGRFHDDRVRLAGNVLIWQRGPLTIRIEGTRTLAAARALARSLR